MKLLRAYANEVVGHLAPANLFPQMPTIHFYPQVEICPHCNSQLHVRKSGSKTVVTMDIGAFRAKETVLQCEHDQMIFSSERLRALVPARCTFGYDVIVYVGYALFVHCRSDREIVRELAARNISISDREISFLGKKFVTYLALAHRESRQQIRQAMELRGGYILHLDGTCEADSPHLFSGLDGIAELVLDNVKLPSERADSLIPFLKQIKQQYGEPIALVHDMGKGILLAVQTVFAGKPDFICHFHFWYLSEREMLGRRASPLGELGSPPQLELLRPCDMTESDVRDVMLKRGGAPLLAIRVVPVAYYKGSLQWSSCNSRKEELHHGKEEHLCEAKSRLVCSI